MGFPMGDSRPLTLTPLPRLPPEMEPRYQQGRRAVRRESFAVTLSVWMVMPRLTSTLATLQLLRWMSPAVVLPHEVGIVVVVAAGTGRGRPLHLRLLCLSTVVLVVVVVVVTVDVVLDFALQQRPIPSTGRTLTQLASHSCCLMTHSFLSSPLPPRVVVGGTPKQNLACAVMRPLGELPSTRPEHGRGV